MTINRATPGITLLAASILFSGCANHSVQPTDPMLAEDHVQVITTDPDLTSEESATKQSAKLDELSSEPALFSYIDPDVEPLMWTSETEESEILTPGTSRIVGQLPGQRALSFELFDEVAIPHNFTQQGTVIFYPEKSANDLWQRVRAGFALPHQSHPRIDANIKWYARHPAYIDRVVKRAEKYLHFIVEEAEKAEVPLEIALLPVVESAFQPFAYSHGRAAGIWQFIPATGKLYGLKQNWWYDGRRDVVASTRAALKFLKTMRKSFNNDWLLALAAYNSGWGTVSKAIKRNKRKGKGTDFWSLDLPRETEGYVPKLLAISEIIAHPEKYNLTINPIANKPYMAEVDTESQIDLALAADLAEISLEDLYVLNPGFNRWATDPRGPHKLMVPVDKVEVFNQNLAELPKSKRLAWVRHSIKRGESLLSIADKYNTTVKLIKNVNNIRGNLIREKQSLMIPVSSLDDDSYTLSAEQRKLALQNTKRKGKEKLTYHVRPGDTFWSISRKFDVGYRSLAKWNGMAPRDTLHPGQRLTIWKKGGAVHRAAFSPHSSQLTTQKVNYRVRRGDSLARIARKFRVEISDLKKWNRSLYNKKYLQPGDRITVYVDVTQQAGRT